jgi:hypothetical protein
MFGQRQLFTLTFNIILTSNSLKYFSFRPSVYVINRNNEYDFKGTVFFCCMNKKKNNLFIRVYLLLANMNSMIS